MKEPTTVSRVLIATVLFGLAAGLADGATPAPAVAAEGKPSKPVAPMNPAGDGIATDAGAQSDGRHGDYSRKAAKGPHLKVVAATFFGSDGCEEFVDAGGLPDGTVVAFGNAWGPQFVKSPEATVLGSGRHSGKAVARDGKGNLALDYASPDSAGTIVCYTEDLSAIRKIVRMDWGVANIRSGRIASDGKGLIVAGQCHPAFKSFSSGCSKVNALPYQAPAPGGKHAPPDPATLGDVYVARFSADTLKPEWIWLLEKCGAPPDDIFTDPAGAIYFDAGGLRRVSPDGREMKRVNSRTHSGTAKWLGVDPTDGGVFFGGDRNTHTGQQPYRQPYLYKFDTEGKKVATLWEPDPKTVGSATGALESDSSPRALAWATNGDMLVSGWSDGGNSVFPKQALDWHKPATSGGMGIQTWGMKNANSLGHIMRIDPRTWETKSHSWWAAFIPGWFHSARSRNAPNFVSIDQLCVLKDGSVAIAGSAATGLIQTPNGFWIDPKTGEKSGGAYVSVFLPDLSNLLFSSYVPGCWKCSLGATRKGLVAVSRSKGADGVESWPTLSPTVRAIQKTFGGGTDGHIVVFELPPAR